MSGVKDRVALVTGAGSPEGIGFATARLLYSVGARVAITSTTDRINQRRDEIKGTSEDVFSQTADLTDSVAVNSLIEQIENVLGPIEIVINNAGMVQIGRDEPSTLFHEVSDEQWRYGIDINLTSAFMVTRAVLPGMMERNYGRIINISSVTGPSVGIAGSSILKDNVTIAGQVGIVGHLIIGKGSSVAAKSAVYQSLDPESFVSGIPARHHKNRVRQDVVVNQLPDILNRIRKLEKELPISEEN